MSDVRDQTRAGLDASDDEAIVDVRDAGAESEALVDDADELRTRWDRIQTMFVDEPRQAVEQADELVTTVVERLARSFRIQRDALEQEWSAGDDVSTEALRLALQRYRSLFERLLAA